jgi:hypothetical protein
MRACATSTRSTLATIAELEVLATVAITGVGWAGDLVRQRSVAGRDDRQRCAACPPTWRSS